MLLIKTNEDPNEIDFTDFYDFYFKYIVSIKNLPILLPSKNSFFAFIVVIFIIGILTSILRFITESREDQNTIEKVKVSKTWSFLNKKLIVCQKNALSELHQASDKCYSKQNSNKCIELIIYWPHFINMSLPNSNGITPFHRVCYRGNYNLIDFMISRGANIFQETEYGETAFHMLIDYYIRNPMQKNFNCLELLFGKGYFLKKDDNFFKQFILDAQESENKELERWLTFHAIPVSNKKEYACSSERSNKRISHFYLPFNSKFSFKILPKV